MEAYLAGRDMPKGIKNAWKRVRTAAEMPAKGQRGAEGATEANEAISKIQKEIVEIKGIIQA